MSVTNDFHNVLGDSIGFFIRTFGDETAKQIQIILNDADKQITQLQAEVKQLKFLLKAHKLENHRLGTGLEEIKKKTRNNKIRFIAEQALKP